jgi:hypothetical protein
MSPSAKALSLALGLLGFAAGPGGSASAQQFSADLVTTNTQGQPIGEAGNLYVGDGVVRIEAPEFRRGRFLVNVNIGTALFVIPAQRVFMDAKQSSRLTQILVPVDPNDPCRTWTRMAQIAGVADQVGQWRCERLGTEAAGGGPTIKYLATSPDGEKDSAWIDGSLRFPVKFKFADGSGIALSDIRRGPQPTALFSVPAGYRKFDPRRLIERIKQSDVWVDPPK